jgi:repressor LexA
MELKEKANQSNLTPRQVQLLRAISGFRQDNYCSPTIGELAGKLGISRSTAFEHIEELRKKGYLSSCSGRARSLEPTSKALLLLKGENSGDSLYSSEQADSIPLVGRVAAGSPIEAIEDRRRISFADCFGNGDEIFALEVKGDSMKDEGIDDGDYVICRKSSTAEQGQLVIAIVDGDNATLKRFYKEKGAVRLQPANDEYQPIYTANCRIGAVVVGLVRRF